MARICLHFGITKFEKKGWSRILKEEKLNTVEIRRCKGLGSGGTNDRESARLETAGASARA